jgi:hypothetical protein
VNAKPDPRMLMPEVKANIWLADELKPHEQSWTKPEGRRSLQTPSQACAKGRQLKKINEEKCSVPGALWTHTRYPCAK